MIGFKVLHDLLYQLCDNIWSGDHTLATELVIVEQRPMIGGGLTSTRVTQGVRVLFHGKYPFISYQQLL